MSDMGQDLSDPRVRDAIRQRAPEAWALLHEKCHAWLRRRAEWLVDVASDADDAVSETWHRAWKGANAYDPRWSPRTWLSGILAHVCADIARHEHRRRTEPLTDAADGVEQTPYDDRARARDALREAIALLPPRQRAVLRLNIFGHASVAEIARMLGAATPSVHHCLARAIRNVGRTLRRRFGGEMPF